MVKNWNNLFLNFHNFLFFSFLRPFLRFFHVFFCSVWRRRKLLRFFSRAAFEEEAIIIVITEPFKNVTLTEKKLMECIKLLTAFPLMFNRCLSWTVHSFSSVFFSSLQSWKKSFVFLQAAWVWDGIVLLLLASPCPFLLCFFLFYQNQSFYQKGEKKAHKLLISSFLTANLTYTFMYE